MDQYEEQDYTKGFDLGLWKKLARFAAKYKIRFIILILANVTIAVADTIYAQMSKYAIDNFIANSSLDGLPVFIALYALLIAVQVSGIFLFIKLAGYIEVHIVADVRHEGFDKLQSLSFSYYDKTPVGWIMARMTSDAQRIGDVFSWGITEIAWGVAYLLFIMIFMFANDWKLALIALSSTPLILITSIYFQKIILKGHRLTRKLNSKITGAFNEGINGAKTTKTLVREEANFQEFAVLTSDMKKASIRVASVSAVFRPLLVSLSSIGVGLVLYRGGILTQQGVLMLGSLSLFISYAVNVFDPIMNIAGMFSEFQAAQASAERTFSLLEQNPDIVDTDEVLSVYGDAMNPKRENWEAIEGTIEFNNVSFYYNKGEDVLTDFNLRVKPGEKIALVGETGSGKSTIVNLICRFYEPVSGEILIDGKNYKERSQICLQSNLGYVLQTPHLFSGTIMDNIRYSYLDATDEQVIEAAKTVNAYPFIMKLDKGFQTDVGEGGNRLSTGEKQLVSFARAILGDPRIFVLDEATSSIDTETEQIIQKAVFSILEGRTSFIVAHRLSTIRSCDRILVIENGKVIENGNHKQLMNQKGHYHNLYTNQFKEEYEKKILLNQI